jgi:hypothetical protein
MGFYHSEFDLAYGLIPAFSVRGRRDVAGLADSA